MAPIGSVIKNSIIFIVITAIVTYLAVFLFLVNGMTQIISFATDNGGDIQEGATLFAIGLIIIIAGMGLALNLTLPSVVGDEMYEF